MGVAEIHGAWAENGAGRVQVAEKEDDVASTMSASTADVAGEHVASMTSASTSDVAGEHVVFSRSVSQGIRRQRIAERRARLRELIDLEEFASVSGLPDFKKSATADAGHGERETRRQRIAERRARLRELCGTTLSEHGLGFCSSDCTACRRASEGLGQATAAPASRPTSRRAVSEADVIHSKSGFTADPAKSASTAGSDSDRAGATPASALFDLDRLASAVWV